MGNFDVRKKIVYAKFKNLYIPLINNRIINRSFNLYNPSRLRGKILKKSINFIVKINKINYLYQSIDYIDIDKTIEKKLENIEGYKCHSIYIGENYINDIWILQLMNENGDILGYAKLLKDNSKKGQIKNEISNLVNLKNLELKSAYIPEIIYFDENYNIFIESTKDGLKDDRGRLKNSHIKFLNELYQKTNKVYEFNESEFYRKIMNRIESSKSEKYRDISRKVLDKVDLEEIEYCYSHGDFYSPNIKLYKDSIFIYDFEMSGMNPIYYDIFHYIVNLNIINIKKSKEKIIKQILSSNKFLSEYEIQNNISNKLRVPMFIIYLYEVIDYFYENTDCNNGTFISYIQTLNILLDNI